MTSSRVKARLVDGIARLKILIDHPMLTGRQRDAITGSIIPAHYIERLTITHNGKVVIDSQLSTAVSRHPHLSFELRGAVVGDAIRVTWQDNLGRTGQQEVRVQPAVAD